MNTSQFLASLERLAADPQPVQFELSKVLAFQIVSTVQLACRHPRFDGPTRANVEPAIRDLGRAISANDPDLRMLIEMGWQPQFDDVTAPPPLNEVDPSTWRCERCGCTEEHACEEVCHWIHARLCSACATPVEISEYDEAKEPLEAELSQRIDALVDQFKRERHYPFLLARTPAEPTSRIITP